MIKNLKKFIFDLIDDSKRRQNKKIVAGYEILKSRGDITLIQDVRYAISIHENKNFSIRPLRTIFFDHGSMSDLIIRQYLVKRVGEIGLHKSLLRAIGGGSKVHLLPPSTFDILSDKKVPISYWGSFFYWYFYVFLIWLYGLGFIISSTLKPSFGNRSEVNAGKYCYFIDLPNNAFPKKDSSFSRYDLVSWYNSWSNRNLEIRSICHNAALGNIKRTKAIPMRYQKNPWPDITQIKPRLSLLKWGVCATTRALIDLFQGRWWHAFLLYEATKAKIIDVIPKDALATEYWFNHENYKYKPLWTYIAENHGAYIYLYFYSINNQTVQTYDAKPSISGYWHLMNWKNCVVWGSHQEQLLRQYTNYDTNYIHVEEIPYTDSDVPLDLNSEFKVAIFDVPIRNKYHNCLMGQSYQYYSYRNSESFFEQIIKCSRQVGASVIIKRKDRGSDAISKKYLKLIANLDSSFSNVCSLDPTISPHRVIKEADAVISMPFTSTALIAKAFSKPACYYDPTGLLDKNSIYAYGIPVIQKSEHLTQWLQSIPR